MTGVQTCALPIFGWDPLRDYSYVTLLAVLPSLLMVHPSIPAKNVRELVALAKARPGALTYASTGQGTSPHMMMEMFKSMAGVNMVHVPYKGAAPAMVDLIAGRTDLGMNSPVFLLPMVRSGKLRAIGITGNHRMASAQDIPTIAESGLPGFELSGWQGLLVPAATPREIVVQLNAAVQKILMTPEIKRVLEEEIGRAHV